MKITRPYYQHMVSDIEEMDEGYLYHPRCFERVVVSRGRILTEALRNDPEAPKGQTYSRVRYFSKEEILKYVEDISGDVRNVVIRDVRGFPKPADPSGASGIYFLKRDGEVVYIGQALNVLKRVLMHVNQKQFDSVDFMPCDESHLNDLEGLFIKLLKPVDNAEPYVFSGFSAPKSKLWDSIVPIHGVRSRRHG